MEAKRPPVQVRLHVAVLVRYLSQFVPEDGRDGSESSILIRGNGYGDDRSSAFAGGDIERAVAHQFKALADIVQGDMRLVVVGGIKIRPVVFDDYHAAAVRLAGPDADMQRLSV